MSRGGSLAPPYEGLRFRKVGMSGVGRKYTSKGTRSNNIGLDHPNPAFPLQAFIFSRSVLGGLTHYTPW